MQKVGDIVTIGGLYNHSCRVCIPSYESYWHSSLPGYIPRVFPSTMLERGQFGSPRGGMETRCFCIVLYSFHLCHVPFLLSITPLLQDNLLPNIYLSFIVISQQLFTFLFDGESTKTHKSEDTTCYNPSSHHSTSR